MKKYLIILYSLMAMGAITSCNSHIIDIDEPKEANEPNPEEVVCPVSNTGIVYKRSSNMAFDLFEKVNSTAKKDENFMISPISLSEVLGMISTGAEGETRNELNKFLGFGDVSQAEMCVAFKDLNSWLPSADEMTTVNLANSMWIDDDFSVLDTYKSTNQNYFDAETRVADLAAEKTKDEINSWCDKQTKGCIKKILDKPLDGSAMALINALYFKGEWTKRFKTSETTKKQFTSANGNVSEVDMMHKYDDLKYISREKFSMVELPYGNGNFCMDIILPNKGVKLEECVANLKYEDFGNLLDRMSFAPIELSMPKMKLEYNIELNDILKDLGVKRIFSPFDAELHGISPDDIYVSLVKQFSYINVDEAGSVAAAVTEADYVCADFGDDVTPDYVEFNMNRPFVYIIRDTQTGAILFMGRVMTL